MEIIGTPARGARCRGLLASDDDFERELTTAVELYDAIPCR